MRIVGRSESPSFPSLEALLPMEDSWALEVEKEEEALFLQSKSEHLQRGGDSVNQTETSWVSCKRLNSGSTEACQRSLEREDRHYIRRPSRFSDSKPSRNDQHLDSSRPSEETEKAWQFKPSSRCYPPSVNIRSSDFSVTSEKRAHQRSLHESRRSARPDRTSNSFTSMQHSTGLKDGFCRGNQGAKPSVNTLKRRQDHFACPDRRRRQAASVYEASRKSDDYSDDRSHFQAYQSADESKHEFQPLFDKHRQYRHGHYSAKSEFSEHRSNQRGVKKIAYQGQCHEFTYQKDAESCMRSIGSEMRQHMGALVAGQNCEEKPRITNGKSVTTNVEKTTETALPEGSNLLTSSHTEESEVKHDDSRVVMEQYEMLACLLFDDLQDLDEDPDAECMDEGPGENSRSIIDNESEVNMDVDIVREVNKDVSEKPSAACTTKQFKCDFSGTSALKASATKKFQDGDASLGLKKSPPVLVDVTNKFEIHTSAGVKRDAQEDDAHRLSQRQRQIDFGKNTLGYERYTELIPRIKRKAKDPQTPNPKQVCSKRSWDGQIRKWRRLLHVYDPPSEDGEEIAEDFSILKLLQGNLQIQQDTSSAPRALKADGSKVHTGVGERKNGGDASLAIYEDWMES